MRRRRRTAAGKEPRHGSAACVRRRHEGGGAWVKANGKGKEWSAHRPGEGRSGGGVKVVGGGREAKAPARGAVEACGGEEKKVKR